MMLFLFTTLLCHIWRLSFGPESYVEFLLCLSWQTFHLTIGCRDLCFRNVMELLRFLSRH